MQGDEGYKLVGNMAIEAKSNSARIGLLNVLVSQFNTGRTTCKKETIYHYDRKNWVEKGSIRDLQKIAQIFSSTVIGQKNSQHVLKWNRFCS